MKIECTLVFRLFKLVKTSIERFHQLPVRFSGVRVPFKDVYQFFSITEVKRSTGECSFEHLIPIGYVPRPASASRALLRLSPCY